MTQTKWPPPNPARFNRANDFLEKIDQTCATENLEDIEAEGTDDETVTEAISERVIEVTDDYILRRIHDRLDGYEFEQFVAHILEKLVPPRQILVMG